MCFINGLLFVTILIEKSLRKRKEMIVMSGMALADFILGSGAFLLGTYRVCVSVTGHDNESATNWECARLPPIILINMGLQMTAVMNLVVSIDRLTSVKWPGKYQSFSAKYIKRLIAPVWLFFAASLSAMLLSSYINDPPATQTLMCLGGPFKLWYSRFQFLFIIAVEYVSVIIYIQVFVLYKKLLGNF
uniref:G-protein coupled receptors family 1 profile domain-containing protein n=1 Tax=Plectus sambesii TaxID=2011161 RepID=A0A914W8J6_9BILA